MKTIKFLLPVIFSLFAVASTSFCQSFNQWNETDLNKMEKAAHSFISAIPEDVISNYGIDSDQSIEASMLGLPVQVFTISEGSLVTTDSWRVPLLIGNEYKALFTIIEETDGGFMIVDFGATTLAQELYSAIEFQEVKGILRVYELRRDFFIILNPEGETEFLPIPKTTSGNYSFNDILNMIR